MFWLIKMVLGLGFMALLFGFGYLWGSQKSYPLQSAVNLMRSELTSKIETLEHGLRRTRLRMELMNARNHLMSAQNAAKERNYGAARQELERVINAIDKVSETVEPSQKKELDSLTLRVKAVQKKVSRPNPPAQIEFKEVIENLDRFLS